MKAVEIIFSPTGGTQKVSEIITNNWNLDTQRIDLTNPHLDYGEFEIGEEDIALIAMPVFGSHPPAVAIERLRQVNGNKARCVVVCVYGNGDYGNTLNDMKIAAEDNDFKVVAAIAAVAQHSIIPEYATDRPDGDDISVLNDFAEKSGTKRKPFQQNLMSKLKMKQLNPNRNLLPSLRFQNLQIPV